MDDQYVAPFPIDKDSVRCIVDVGANVGYSIVYFAALFPQSHIVAFEPHPAHVAQIRHHIHVNGLSERVTLHAAAAGIGSGEVFLSDSESSSSIVTGEKKDGWLLVPLVDWFALLPSGQIDFLKIDIEGAEFALMSDERFKSVAQRSRVVSLEWHRTVDHQDAYTWCRDQLISHGFTVHEGTIHYDDTAGTLWACKT